MITLYGISNCDTVKKARKALDAQGTEYQFHDFRKQGLDEALLKQWTQSVSWETLLNKRGTTWRKLDDAVKADVTEEKALALMLEQPTLIKRPVLTLGDNVMVGFSIESYQKL